MAKADWLFLFSVQEIIDPVQSMICFCKLMNNTVYHIESVMTKGEKILEWPCTCYHRGTERRSVLVGNSVHNQRIERLWKDSHHCATSIYYRLFYYLKQNELLDPIDQHHLLALHHVYLPSIK